MKVSWRFFQSRKLALVLIAVIVVVSIIGTVIPQNAAHHIYIERFGVGGYTFLRLTGITDLYHSWWFNLVFVFFSLNIIACSINRIKIIYRSLHKTVSSMDRKRIASLKNFQSFEIQSGIEKLPEILRKRGFRTIQIDTDDSSYIKAEKGVISKFGSTITHFSMLIIFIGVAVGIWKGFKFNVNINEGETIPVPRSNFYLRLDEFTLEYYEKTGKPKDYKSRLTIIENEKEMLTKTIEVNYPLKYKGIVFFQSSYGLSNAIDSLEIHLALRDNSHKSTHISSHRLRMGETFIIPNTDYRIAVEKFLSDFVIDKRGKPTNRSTNFENPSVLLKVFKGDTFVFDVWSFKKFGIPHLPKDFKYNMSLVNVFSKKYSGLMVTHDPGVPIVWAGCFLIIVGLFISFYTSYRIILIHYFNGKKKTTIEIGGSANKDLSGFEKEYERLVSQLKEL